MNVDKSASRSSSLRLFASAAHCDRLERVKQKISRQKLQQVNSGIHHGRKSQIQVVGEHLSNAIYSLFPTLNENLLPIGCADRAGLALLERDAILRRASGGFRLFVRKFTDQQLLKCLRTPALNTLGQWAPPNLRYIHTLRNAWKKLTQFERFDWQEQFEHYAKNEQNSNKLGISLNENELLEGSSSQNEDEQRLCQIQWLSTIDLDHLPCPLCSFGNPRRFSIGQLLAHLSLSHHSAHLYACHCCSKAFNCVEALKAHGANGQCRPFMRYLRENAQRMGDEELIFDFVYASLICAECGLHLILSPRCDQDKLDEALLSIILSHSNQSLSLCLVYTSVELTQPSIKIQFLRPLIFEPVPKCEFCLRSGWASPIELERHCAIEHGKWATHNDRLLNCSECSAKFFTAPLFCDHLLSKHLQTVVPLSTQLLRTIPQYPPALDKGDTVLIGTVGIDRLPSARAYTTGANPLKWVPAAERTAREGELRRSKRKRKRRRLHTPAPEDDDDEIEENEDEEDDFDADWDEKETSGAKCRPNGSLSLYQNLGRWKTKMRFMEEQAFLSDGPLAGFVAQLELPVQVSGKIIVRNTLDGALLTESVYQCSKCSIIIFGESSVTDHIIQCHQIKRNDNDDFEQMLTEYVFDNVEALFVAGNFPFTRIRCDLCSIDCCSVVSLRRHYAQCHGILCALQPNRSTVKECAEVLLRRDWANTAFDRELLQQINSSHPPKCTSELESECNGSANLDQLSAAMQLNGNALYSSLLHPNEQQQHQEAHNSYYDQGSLDSDDNGIIQLIDEFKEEPTTEDGQEEHEREQHQQTVDNDEQGEAEKPNSSFDKTTSDGDVSVIFIKEELSEEGGQESGKHFLNSSSGKEFFAGVDDGPGNSSSADLSSSLPDGVKREESPGSSPSSNATFEDFLHRSDELTNKDNNDEQDKEEDEEQKCQMIIDESDQQQTTEKSFASEDDDDVDDDGVDFLAQHSSPRKIGAMKRGVGINEGQPDQQVDDHEKGADQLMNGEPKWQEGENGSDSGCVRKVEEDEEETIQDCDYSKNDQESLADHCETDADDHTYDHHPLIIQYSPKKRARKRGRPRKTETIVRDMWKMKKTTKMMSRRNRGKAVKKTDAKMKKAKMNKDEEWLLREERPKRPYTKRKSKEILSVEDEKKIGCCTAATVVEPPTEAENEGKLNEVETIMKGMERHFHRKRGRPKKKALASAERKEQQQQHQRTPSTSNAVAVAMSSSTFVCFMCTAVEREFDAFGAHLRSHPEQWSRCTICTTNDTENNSNAIPSMNGDNDAGEQQAGAAQHDNKKHQRRVFDHPVHFLKHLIECHMIFKNDRVQCPWCEYLIQFNLANQKYRASAAMFRHMVYECGRSSVCLLCGYDVSPSVPSTTTTMHLASSTVDNQLTGRQCDDQLIKKHRIEKHQLIFDRFICFSCKGGFYSREQFLHHTCELALRCTCNPSFRFLTEDDYSQHLAEHNSGNNLGQHGLMQAEHEVDIAKRKCVLNEDYRNHVAHLDECKHEQNIERESAKTVAEIKKKVAVVNHSQQRSSTPNRPNEPNSVLVQQCQCAHPSDKFGVVLKKQPKMSSSSNHSLPSAGIAAVKPVQPCPLFASTNATSTTSPNSSSSSLSYRSFVLSQFSQANQSKKMAYSAHPAVSFEAKKTPVP